MPGIRSKRGGWIIISTALTVPWAIENLEIAPELIFLRPENEPRDWTSFWGILIMPEN
jgi:hypothetical protein